MSETPIKIRMRSDQIDILENDPFKNDLFDRQKPTNDLTKLVGNIDTPAVIAIDGAWGTGKTTFLDIWKQSLFDNRILLESSKDQILWSTQLLSIPICDLRQLAGNWTTG